MSAFASWLPSMFGQFLIPQSTIVGHGHGPAVALGSANCGLLQLTLVI